MSKAEELARQFHETYERLATSHGYETRRESAVPWADVPAVNKSLMIAVCEEILDTRGARIRAIKNILSNWEVVQSLRVLGVTGKEIAEARKEG